MTRCRSAHACLSRPRLLAALIPALCLAARLSPAASSLSVVTATAPQNGNDPLRVVLTWPAPAPNDNGPPFIRFNLYRKIDPSAPYPKNPINYQPLAVYGDCSKLRNFVPLESPDWRLMTMAIGGENGGDELTNPCSISGLSQGSPELQRLHLLARSRWPVAVVLGQGYVDEGVVQAKTYLYELRGVDGQGQETVLATGVTVTAGVPVKPPSVPGIAIQAGDHQVLLHWPRLDGASSYNVYRATSPNGSFDLINEMGVTPVLLTDLQGDFLNQEHDAEDGFLDFQRWDPSGNPIAHEESGVFIDGPDDGVAYYYKVAAADLLGYEGPLSSAVHGTPHDSTPPAVPGDVTVVPDDPGSRIEVRWAAVARDTGGHPESVTGYRVYRKDQAGGTGGTLLTALVDGNGQALGSLIPQPSNGATLVEAFDKDPNLRPPYGEKVFWYSVECVDAEGNVSARSAAISGHLKDITPPAPPHGLKAAGAEGVITVSWSLSSEPDVDGYEVYRSLCDAGQWACQGKKLCTGNEAQTGEECCDSSFVFLGSISQDQALAAVGGPAWPDTTVPSGSPLCYAYLVKVIDQSQNKSGAWPPNPSVAPFEPYVCQHLRDTTPPEPAIIVGVFNKDHAVEVDWIAGPVQDIRAYHVYRATSEIGNYGFVGGMTVEKPPAPPVFLPAPYQAPAAVGCDVVPLHIHDGMSAGSLVDATTEPKRVYWYKVVGIDWAGNETRLDKAVPVSTFTFTAQPPPAPSITAVTPSSQPCGLRVQWSPGFDATKHLGFAVFRRETAGGLFLQIGSLVGASEYLDKDVARGVTYSYRLALVNLDRTSSMSVEKSGTVN